MDDPQRRRSGGRAHARRSGSRATPSTSLTRNPFEVLGEEGLALMSQRRYRPRGGRR